MTTYTEVIPPGSEGKIQASVDVSHLKGRVQKYVDFSTNDPVNSQSRVLIKANVKTLVNIEPVEVVRFMINKGQTETMDLTITTENSIKLHNAVVNSNYFSATMSPGASPNQYKLKVSTKESIPIGSVKAEIRISGEGPQKEVVIPVTARVLGPLRVEPAMVTFVVKGHPEQVETILTVDVKQGPEMESVTVKKLEPGKQLTVISQNDDWYQVILSEKVSIVKNSAGKEVKIPSRTIGWIKTTAVKDSKGAAAPEPLKVSVQNANGRSFKLLDYKSTDPDVKVVLEKKPEETSYSFVVSLQNVPKKKGLQKSSIVVRTDNPEQPEVNIPVYITVT